MKNFSRKKRIVSSIGLLVAVALSIIIGHAVLAQRDLYYGYFSNYHYGAYSASNPNGVGYSSTASVFDDNDGGFSALAGAPSESKAGFISFVLGKFNGTNNGSEVAVRRSEDRLGAAYIIQTMRGGNEYSYPTAAEITDWENRINDSAITMTTANVSFTVNTGIKNRAGVPLDVAQYVNGETNVPSVVFKSGSTIDFEIKILCGNPIGQFPGVPTPAPKDYSLTPITTGNVTYGQPGDGVTVSSQVKNTGVASTNTSWVLSTVVYSPTAKVPTSVTTSASAPCVFFKSGTGGSASACGNTTPVYSGTRGFPGDTTVTLATGGVQTIGNYPVGTRVCYSLSVHNRTTADVSDQYANSKPACVTVGKAPKVDVLGGDLIVGRNFGSGATGSSSIYTSQSQSASGITYGSWAEYGVFATKTVTGIGSGSAFGGPGLGVGGTVCDYSALVFTNQTSKACSPTDKFGGYGNASSTPIPNVASAFPVGTQTLGGSVNVGATPKLQGIYSDTSTNITVSGGTLAPGQWIVLNAPNATVTITGNINYTTASLNGLSQIPQMVIIAKNIIIADSSAASGVTHVDSWLIASGYINTCGAIAYNGLLTASICSEPLLVNGPVMTSHLYLNRTAGSTVTSPGTPAETFNLRADAYLWAYQRSLSAGTVQTIYSTELPPRF